MHSRCCQRSSHHWWIRGISHHFTSFPRRFQVFFSSVYRFHMISYDFIWFHGLANGFSQWFSLSKPPVSREESDLLVWRVLLIWKRAMRQFPESKVYQSHSAYSEISESSILSYPVYHSLYLFINASPKDLLCLENVSWCPISPSNCFCFRIQRRTELRNFCFVASQVSVSELVSLRGIYKHLWDLAKDL